MAAQTGNTYISGIVRDSIEIQTANLGFSTMTSSKKVGFGGHVAILCCRWVNISIGGYHRAPKIDD